MVSTRRLDHRDLGVTAGKAAELQAAMDAAGVSEADLRERFVLGRGRGGQKVNKTASVCQLTHVPTGTVVTCGSERSRARNRFFARRRLVERLTGMGDPTASGAGHDARVAKQKARRRRRARSASRVRPAMHILTATYPDTDTAAAALERLVRAGDDLDVDVDLLDAAVAARGLDGKVHIHHQHDRRTGAGAVGGLLCGLFLAALFPPAAIAEVLLGAVGGAVGGHFSGHADREEFRAVAGELEAGKAALIALLDADTKMTEARRLVDDADSVADAPIDHDEAERLRLAF